MIRHIVMWKFRPGEEENVQRFLEGLCALKNQIPGIAEMEVARDCGREGHYDAVLVSAFRSREDLERYRTDPRHVAVSGLCAAIREDRAAVDYEF